MTHNWPFYELRKLLGHQAEGPFHHLAQARNTSFDRAAEARVGRLPLCGVEW